MATITRTITDVTDDLTGENVNADAITSYPFAFGDVSGTVDLTADSLAKINALPEFAKLIEAARASAANAPKNNGSGSRNTKVVLGAYPWERRAFAATKGLADASKGGVLSTEAEKAFADAVADGSYTVIGSAKPPASDASADGSAASADPMNAVNAETPVPASGGRTRK